MGKSRKMPPAHRCTTCNKAVSEEDWGESMRCPECTKKLIVEVKSVMPPAAQPDAQQEARRVRRLRSRAARLLPLLYADLPATGGEIDEIERELEEYGLAYDQATRRIVAIADEDDEEE